MFESYEVGKSYPGAIGHAEGVLFDVTDNGIVIPIYFDGPKPQEIEQLKSGKDIKMAYVAKNNVLIILMKFGSLEWMSAPYSPHLSRFLTHLPDKIEDTEGFAVHLLLFDTSNGELKTQRMFSLRSKMSNDLMKEMKKIFEKPFDRAAYAADIQSAYRFSDSELVKQARMTYRIQ